MGAEYSSAVAKGATMQEAFRAAVSDAQYDHGHAGYSGSLAEKNSATVHKVPRDFDPVQWVQMAERMMYPDADDRAEAAEFAGDFLPVLMRLAAHLKGDKWGPAAAVKIADGKWFFGGYCSS